jgi:hypothetical protein
LHTYFLPKGWIVMNSPLRERQEKNNKSLKIDSLNWISTLKFKPLCTVTATEFRQLFYCQFVKTYVA